MTYRGAGHGLMRTGEQPGEVPENAKREPRPGNGCGRFFQRFRRDRPGLAAPGTGTDRGSVRADRCAATLAACVIATNAVQADEVNFAAYQRTAEDREDSCWHIRYSKCDGVVRTDDLVFVFPCAEFQRATVVVKQLQRPWNVLREMTGINPVKPSANVS